MALTTDDLFGLELKVRMHAHSLRKEVEAQPATTPGLKAMDDAKLADAKAYDAVGDLLMGLQGDWPQLGPLVRDGYKLETKRRGGVRAIELPSSEQEDAA